MRRKHRQDARNARRTKISSGLMLLAPLASWRLIFCGLFGEGRATEGERRREGGRWDRKTQSPLLVS
jgi:hypothetical protein